MPERPRILSTKGGIVRASNAKPRRIPAWRALFQSAIRDLKTLCDRLEIPLPQGFSEASAAAKQFPILVPEPYLARIKKGDPTDPLLLQVLASSHEMASPEGFTSDPLQELAVQTPVSASLIQKYDRRALVITTGACAIHCRYCFRRHFPYGEAGLTPQRMQETLTALAADPTLDELILSGGDPLSLSDRRLREFVVAVASIPHVQRLRVHTRLPIVIPQRVTRGLIKLLKESRLAPWVVVHINHANELDRDVERALARLIDAGIPVLNQAVLLRGVNDSIEALESLCRKLVNIRVAPYYLHQLDKVTGAAHFEVSEEIGRQLIDRLRERLPGYAVPRYVREIAGERSKTPLT
jgi:EF-P beta-lysylation protein EpmB